MDATNLRKPYRVTQRDLMAQRDNLMQTISVLEASLQAICSEIAEEQPHG